MSLKTRKLGGQVFSFLVELHLIDAEFCHAWIPHFCRSGHLVVTVNHFLRFVDKFLSQEPAFDLRRMAGQDLLGVATALKVYGWWT